MTHCRGPSILARADSEFYCVALLGAALLYLIDHALEIGIAGAKAPGKPIAATLDKYRAAGVRRIVALRGDLPATASTEIERVTFSAFPISIWASPIGRFITSSVRSRRTINIRSIIV